MKTGDPTTTEARERENNEVSLLLREASQIAVWNESVQITAIRLALRRASEARSLALREAEKIKPQKSETFHYRDSGYTSGWVECETAYRAAIRALGKDDQ